MRAGCSTAKTAAGFLLWSSAGIVGIAAARVFEIIEVAVRNEPQAAEKFFGAAFLKNCCTKKLLFACGLIIAASIKEWFISV